MKVVQVGIVGDFQCALPSHHATEAALQHAASRVGILVESRWISTQAVYESGGEELAECDGIWGAPGSPVQSLTGVLCAIERARVSDIPYLGTCAGFQHALIEFTRNVMLLREADSAENDPSAPHVVVTRARCSMPDRSSGAPCLTGERSVHAVAGTFFERICGAARLRGEYSCNFEANPEFVARWQAAGLRVCAFDEDSKMRAFELPQNRYFMATLFQPQLSSSSEHSHRIIEAYLQACACPLAGLNGERA